MEWSAGVSMLAKAAETAVARLCAECGSPVERKRADARFCRSACQIAFANRMMLRGKIMAPYVLAWIAGKGGGHSGADPRAGVAMKELTRIARDFLDEDRKAGRVGALDYLDMLMGDGFLYCDRKRRKRRHKSSPSSAAATAGRIAA